MRILIINPNSSQKVTAAIDNAVQPLRIEGGPAIEVDFLREGPPGIATQLDADSVIVPLARRVAGSDADAFVIACFSDPGLHAAREAAGNRPVLGIAECGLTHALTLGWQFGIIALTAASIQRQKRLVRQMGLQDRYAASIAIDASASESSGDEIRSRLEDAGRQLVEKRGADVVVLGCAGMANHRGALEAAIGVPVVEPTQQAAVSAMGRLLLNMRKDRRLAS